MILSVRLAAGRRRFFCPAAAGVVASGTMSPMAADERLRRLAPLVAAAVGAALAIGPRLPQPEPAQIIAAALVGVAAALVAHAIAAARGAAGSVGGAAAGCWVAAAACEMTRAAAHVPTAAALAAAAMVAAVMGRAAARERALATPFVVVAPAACALAVLEPRAWALVAAAAVVIALRETAPERRYVAIAPALAALTAGVVTLLGAIGRAPGWAPASATVTPAAWLELAVDGMGPIAIVLAVTGAVSLAAERRARWLAAAMVGGLAGFAPLAAEPPTAALVGVALALGTTIAAAAVRVGRPRHQIVAAAAIGALMVTPFAL